MVITVQNISARLTPDPAEPPVNASVRDAEAVMVSLPPIRRQIETHMENVSNKVEQIRSMVALAPFALHIVNRGLVTLVPSTRTIENPLTNEISFDIKTNVSEGLVMYIEGEPQNQTSGRSNWPVSVDHKEIEDSSQLYVFICYTDIIAVVEHSLECDNPCFESDTEELYHKLKKAKPLVKESLRSLESFMEERVKIISFFFLNSGTQPGLLHIK